MNIEDIGQMHPAMVGIVHDDCIPISEPIAKFLEHCRHRLGDGA